LVVAGCAAASAPGRDAHAPDDAAVAGDLATADLTPPAPDFAAPDLADGGAAAGDLGDAGPPTIGPILYPDRTQSPITVTVADGLRQIAQTKAENAQVFAKAGGSNTVNSNFLECFAGTDVDLDARADLEPTRAAFAAGDAAGTNPFQRVSLAAMVGWSSSDALTGAPTPIQAEVTAIGPREAVVQFGTNDIGSAAPYGDPIKFGENMLNIVDQLVLQGVIPILTSIPARNDIADADLQVPRFNAVTRGVAQARQLPFVDLYRELAPLSSRGVGPDGIHLNVFTDGTGAHGCRLTSAGLQFGFNVRNLTTLDALDRVRQIAAGGAAPDRTAPQLRGSGGPSDPFRIDALPFADLHNTFTGGSRTIDSYPVGVCGTGQNESGPEFFYRVDLPRTTTLRAMVIDRGSVDIDVHLLDSTGTAAGCLARADKMLVQTVVAGTYYFALDTFASGVPLVEHSGEYLFVLVAD
jgi:hypothetical protein